MKLKHFLGIYKDMEAVETAFPSGREGDYLIVDNDLKGWNQYSNTWVTPTVDEKASVRKTEQVYGDLDVHNNLRVGGKVSAKLIRGRNSFLGLFDSEEKLRLLFPDPSVGEWGMVFAYTTTPTPEEVSSVEEVSPSEQVEQETESNAETSSNSETRRSTDEICVGYIFICEEAGTWKNTGYKGGYQHGLFEAIQDVQDNVDDEAQAREQAVSDEASARVQADATLLGNVGEGDPTSIAEETAAREQADEALRTQIKLYTVNNNPSDNQLWIDHSEAPDFVLSTACSIKVRFMNGVPANETITLNINNTGEKPLYVNGVPAKRGSWINGDILEIFYDGTRYQAFDTRVYDEGVFDISVYKASSYGELMEFASLNDAITEPSMIPASMQKAGVTVRFVNSSTHRYEWWRYKGLSFSLDATEWEKIIDKNYVDSVAASLQNNIDLEAAARHQEVLAEATAREQAVSAEAIARQQADTNLQENIDTEASTRQQAVAGERAARQQAVAAEATAREQAVSAEATARQQAVTAEKNRAQSAEGELSTAINTEKNRAQGIESNLQQAIESEHDRATVIEGNLSTAISSEVTRATSAEGLLGGRVGNIEGMIPSQASSSNQLADKNFTNSSIATSTATHRGSFNLVSDLGLSVSATQEQIANRIASKLVELGVDADKNDYVFVLIPNEAASPNEILRVERYKHNGTNWGFEFTLNNSSFTAAQWAAINSAITSGLVEKLQALPNNTELTTLLGGKADKAVNAVAGNVAVFNASGNPVDSGTNVAVIYTDGVYDVSAKNGGATFASLSALLSNANLNTLIPTDVRRGGMSIRFIQSSDNKYVQYRLMNQNWSTTVSDWQGVDDEPTAGSNNLVKSGGVYDEIRDMPAEILGGRIITSTVKGSGGNQFISISDIGYSTPIKWVYFIVNSKPENFDNYGFGISNDGTTVKAYCPIVWEDENKGYGKFIKDVSYTHIVVTQINNSETTIKFLSQFPIEGEIKNSLVLQTIKSTKAEIKYSVNLFNISNIETGKYISNVGYENNSSYKITHPIPVKANITYKFPFGSGLNIHVCAITDEDGNILSTIATNNNGVYDEITPMIDCFLVVNIGNGSANNFMFCKKADYPSSFVAYKEDLSLYTIPKNNVEGLESEISKNSRGIFANILGGRTETARFKGNSGNQFILPSAIGYTNLQRIYFQVTNKPNNFDNYGFGISNDGTTVKAYCQVVWENESLGIGWFFKGTSYTHIVITQIVPNTTTIVFLSQNPVNGQIADSYEFYSLLDRDTKNYEFSINLFNKDNYGSGKFLEHSGYTTNASYNVTNPIPVKKGVEYKYQHGSTLGGNRVIAITDRNGNIYGTFNASDNGDGFDVFTSPMDCYIVANIGGLNIQTFMLCESSSYPNSYTPYLKTLKGCRVPSSLVDGNIDNILDGKIIAFDGDSICQGVVNGGGYGVIIATRNNMTYENLGVGGGTIATGTYNEGTETPRHWICTSVLNLREDADYIIIEGGVNDGESLGEYDSNFDSNFDSNTMYGAFDTLCKNLYDRFKGKKIGFIITHGITNTWSNGGARYEIAKKVLTKWGVPTLDLTTEVPPFGLMPANNALRVQYTTNGDGYHPTDECYRKFYCDKIEAWIRTL